MERMSDIADEMEVRREARTCEHHGEYSAELFRFSAEREWVGGACPECLREQQDGDRAAALAAQAQLRMDAMQARAGIPLRYQAATFDGYEAVTDRAEKVRDYCQRYAETFPARREAGTNLILSGGVGTGKTHLACAIARTVIQDHGRTAIYTSVMDAVRRVRSTYQRDAQETESAVLDDLAGVDLLVLDEVGVQSGTDHEHQVIFEVLNRRYSSVRPTVVVTNLGMKSLQEAIGERLVDRLREGGFALVFDWQSYRRRQTS